MNLAKPYIDIGVRTNQLEPMLDFWQNEVGLEYEELLKSHMNNSRSIPLPPVAR